MSAQTDHETYLRTALHAAADSLEPHGDGLQRIRARLRPPRPVPLAWAQAASELVMRTPAWLYDGVYQVADWFRLAYERFAPAQAPGRHRSRAQGLMRPLAAMAVVMFIVAVGTYVAIDGSTAIFPSSSNSQPGAPGGGGHPGTPAPSASHTNGAKSTLGSGSHPAGSPSCTSSPADGATTSAAAPQSPGASATPTPGDTSTDTSSPSPGDTSTTPPAAASAGSSVAPPANPPATSSPSPGLVPKSC